MDKREQQLVEARNEAENRWIAAKKSLAANPTNILLMQVELKRRRKKDNAIAALTRYRVNKGTS